MLLNIKQVNNDIKGKIKRHIETNESENTTIQNLWDTVKAVLRRKSISSEIGLPQETRKSQLNNLTLHLKELEQNHKESPKWVESRKYKNQSKNKQNRV